MLLENFYKNAIDPIAALPHVMDHEGGDAYAESTFSNITSRSEFLIPFLFSASVATISIATGTPNNTAEFVSALGAGAAAGTLLNTVSIATSRIENTEFFIDRTRKQEDLIPSKIKGNLLRRKFVSQFIGVFAPVACTAIAMYKTKLYADAGVDPSMNAAANIALATMGTLSTSFHAANYWRAKRCLDGEWNVTTSKPDQQTEQNVAFTPG